MAVGLVALPGLVYVLGFEGLRWLAGGERPRVVGLVARTCRRAGAGVAGRFGPVRTAAAGQVLDGLERVGFVTRRRQEPVPTVLLVLELRRLAAEVRRIEVSDQPHPAARLAAAYAAYDHVLVQLCTEADVPTPIGLLPLDPRARLGLEADLVASGVDW